MATLPQFQFIVDRAELDGPLLLPATDFEISNVRPLDVSHFADPHTARFIEPVSLIATASLALLTYRIVEHWLSKGEHGVQIDARTSPATVTNLAGIPTGFLVIIAPDGKVSTVSSGSLNSSGLADLLGSIAAGGKPK